MEIKLSYLKENIQPCLSLLTLLDQAQVLRLQLCKQVKQLLRLLEVEIVVPLQALTLLQPEHCLDAWRYPSPVPLGSCLLLLPPVLRRDGGQELAVHRKLPEDVLQVVDVGLQLQDLGLNGLDVLVLL